MLLSEIGLCDCFSFSRSRVDKYAFVFSICLVRKIENQADAINIYIQ